MYSFNNDYSEGAHPQIMQELFATNEEQTAGYSLDPHTERAIALIKERMDCEEADVHILTGGTQVNLTAIASFLRPHHAVIAADSGHIAVHETGAIEATGHKVLTAPTMDGKLTTELVHKIVMHHTDEHMVKPKMVYISNPTEVGTMYSKGEIEQLYSYCKEHKLYLYIDGARLASALTAEDNTMYLVDYPKCCDAFYIGGTKCGALMGEALVIVKEELKEDFRYYIKQKGGLLAKGRILGIQFEVLFRDGLYFELGEHSNKMARELREGISALGYVFMYDTNTNQLFPVFPKEVIEELEKEFVFSIWEEVNERASVVRLVTSWATKEKMVDAFLIKLADITEVRNEEMKCDLDEVLESAE